ncbi:butyrophilin subfamily 3 member A2-like [Thunnus maccoyii]|uniref:butyrophilin subfamily 3 member A2-like n=1 Tax=Thunnus maccoyii TaxID=8240 RepID=UPI001C4B65F1|nr:butyrophilin subfamily 3 member A2-like [Thunnus maccoyii]
MTDITQQNCRVLHQTNRPSLQSPLKILSVLVVSLLLTHSCKGQSQLIGSSQPIVATVGDDVILPCHLEPAMDVAAMTLEWTRSDLDSICVHVQRAHQDFIQTIHPSYRGRTSLFTDELKQGNISLKLSKVKLSDEGKYKCNIPTLNKQSSVELFVGKYRAHMLYHIKLALQLCIFFIFLIGDCVAHHCFKNDFFSSSSGAASSPVISLAGVDRDRGGVVLQCESKGWYPQPEVFWLDGEGNLLSAGPTETVRGPDDLYTVSSKGTVEKRHNNNVTCRVQQNNTNQIRETHIIVPDDFFKVQSSSFPIIIGLAVCIVIIGQGREEAEREVKRLEMELEIKNKKVENKQAECDLFTELQQLREDNQRTEKDLQTMEKDLETKEKKLETIRTAKYSKIAVLVCAHLCSVTCLDMIQFSREQRQRKEQAEKAEQTLNDELQKLKDQLKSKQEEFETKTNEVYICTFSS